MVGRTLAHYTILEKLGEDETLDRSIPPRGLALDRFFGLAIPLSDALAEAHEQGIIHRDLLKPANIMVDERGRPKTVEEVNSIWLAEAAEPSGTVDADPSVIAVSLAMNGEYEEALRWLGKAYATKGDRGKIAGWTFPFINFEPFFEPMRSDFRFQDLLRRMNLAD